MFSSFPAIAFGGGGVRGGLHVGGLMALEKIRGNLTFPNGVYGSSIGSVVATAVAHNMTATQIKTMFDEHFHLENFVPSIRLSTLQGVLSKKGMFSMDLMEDTLTKAFLSQGIDLREKPISSSPQKLYILATNMTTCKPAILSGDIPILKALLCSCCLPFVFHPQVLFNNIYLDGGVSLHCVDGVVPPDCLIFRISKRPSAIFPSTLDALSLPQFFNHIYDVARKSQTGSNTIWFENDDVEILQELTPELRQKMIDQGYSQVLAFFAKRSAEEVDKGIHGSRANVIV
jgi:Patatin-like phospholipase